MGFVEPTAAATKLGVSSAEAENLLRLYSATLREYHPVEHCGDAQDPAHGRCLHCSMPLVGPPMPEIRFRVVIQPEKLPDLDPGSAESCEVMISYRHGESDRLAADLYYAVTRIGMRVFYDKPGIPGATDWERVFIRAASNAGVLILLLSRSYFASSYCKKEIAHAARAGRSLLKVPCGGPTAHADLAWLGRIQEVRVAGNPTGIAYDLERELRTQIKAAFATQTDDWRLDGCTYLLSTMSRPDLADLCSRVACLRPILVDADERMLRNKIVTEVRNDPSRVYELCQALSP